jgi:hypothetical protein
MERLGPATPSPHGGEGRSSSLIIGAGPIASDQAAKRDARTFHAKEGAR